MDYGSVGKSLWKKYLPIKEHWSCDFTGQGGCFILGLQEICKDGNSKSISCCFNAGAEGAFGNCCWFIPCTRPYQNIDRGCTEAFKHCKKQFDAII